MDAMILENKLDSLGRCIQRVEQKCPDDAEALRNDPDLQDIVVLNLGRLLENPLRTQRGLKRAAGVLCCDGKGGSLSERQSAADGRFRPRPPGLSGWPALVVAIFRRGRPRLQKGASIANQPESLSTQRVFQQPASRAVQLCVDIAIHWLADSSQPAPATMGQSFDLLAREGCIPDNLAERLKKSVGFQNIAVHNYEDLDWTIVHAVAKRHLEDFRAFARALDAAIKGQT